MMNSKYEPVQTTDDSAADTNNDASMQESLMGAPPVLSGTVPATPIVEVEAPADLPEGYEFRVSVGNGNHHFLTVTVPPGGVEKGQKWTVPLPLSQHRSPPPPDRDPHHHHQSQQQVTHIPVGHWRDSLLGIFNYGPCHPHCWTAVCCSLLAGGQVIRRLQFTWRGTPSPNAAASAQAFDIIFYITVFHWFMFGFLYLAIYLLDPSAFDEPTEECVAAYELFDYDELAEKYPECVDEPEGMLLVIFYLFDIFKYLYIAITVWLLFCLRRSVRSKYAIPGSPVEDGLCAAVCPCLVAGQLLRHTTDYDVYPSQLCSATGLPDTAPVIV